MTGPPPRRPWWKKKRTWAAIALWVVAGYPLLLGPLTYVHFRGWVPAGTVLVAHEPVRVILLSLPEGRFRDAAIGYNGAYIGWWVRLAEPTRITPAGPETP